MKRPVRAYVAAAALGAALLLPAAAWAAPAPADLLAGARSQPYPGESFARKGGHGGGGGMRMGGGGGGMRMGMGGGHRGFHGGHGHRQGHHGRGGRGFGAAAGIGLAAGLLGAAIASQQPAQPVAYGGGGGWVRYCFRRFGPSFDPGSGTYLAANGYRYPCQ